MFQSDVIPHRNTWHHVLVFRWLLFPYYFTQRPPGFFLYFFTTYSPHGQPPLLSPFQNTIQIIFKSKNWELQLILNFVFTWIIFQKDVSDIPQNSSDIIGNQHSSLEQEDHSTKRQKKAQSLQDGIGDYKRPKTQSSRFTSWSTIR